MAFFETSGRNLLAAEAAAGVGHHVALSVVGTDRLLASGYFRAKMAQEKLVTQKAARTLGTRWPLSAFSGHNHAIAMIFRSLRGIGLIDQYSRAAFSSTISK